MDLVRWLLKSAYDHSSILGSVACTTNEPEEHFSDHPTSVVSVSKSGSVTRI